MLPVQAATAGRRDAWGAAGGVSACDVSEAGRAGRGRRAQRVAQHTQHTASPPRRGPCTPSRVTCSSVPTPMRRDGGQIGPPGARARPPHLRPGRPAPAAAPPWRPSQTPACKARPPQQPGPTGHRPERARVTRSTLPAVSGNTVGTVLCTYRFRWPAQLLPGHRAGAEQTRRLRVDAPIWTGRRWTDAEDVEDMLTTRFVGCRSAMRTHEVVAAGAQCAAAPRGVTALPAREHTPAREPRNA